MFIKKRSKGLPLLSQILVASREYNIKRLPWKRKSIRHFAIKACSVQYTRAVGHLPQETSYITKYLLERGAEIEAQLTSMQYRRSPVTQGGLEIPCKVIVRTPATVLNRKFLDRYKELVRDLYNIRAHGIFSLWWYCRTVERISTKKKKRAAQHNTMSVKSRDIRSMFTKVIRKKSTNTHDISSSSI